MRKCTVEGCERKHHGHGHCVKHYLQIKRHGKILKRTKYTPNEFILESDICRIKLYYRNGSEKGETVIDAEDYEKCKDFKWSLRKDGIVENREKGFLQHFVLGFIPNRTIEIDHANRNRLDNRKENLRQCTPSQNKWNIGKRGNNTSGYKGVCWKKDKQKWVACIRKDHKVTWLGHFKDKIKAAKAYDKAALELHGQFAVLNF